MSCLPTGVPGAASEMNRDEEAAVVAWPCPVLPGEPVHPAAAPASTTPSPAYPIRLAAFLQAGCPALPGPIRQPRSPGDGGGCGARTRSSLHALTVGLIRPL